MSIEDYHYEAFLVHRYQNDRLRDGEKRKPQQYFHTKTILDVCEIKSPLLMATACMDKYIRLISMREKRVEGIFSGHETGVRQLDYTNYFDGFIVSVGYECDARIWVLEGGMGEIQRSLS